MEEEFLDELSQAEAPDEAMEGSLLGLISFSRSYIECVEARVEAFIERSAARPLDLLVSAKDITHIVSSQRHLNAWTALLDPLCKLMAAPTGRWKNVTFDLKVTPGMCTSLRFLQILSASARSGLENVTLEIRTHSFDLSISEAQWEQVLPEGRIDLHSAELRALSVEMTFPDICRIAVSWDGLTNLVINTPPNSHMILPVEAYTVLRLTCRLIHCTICLCFSPSHQTPHLAPLTLPALKSLTLGGFVPPYAFTEALHLPSLDCLHAIEAIGPIERGTASPLLVWIERHGVQLREISLSHSSLPRYALVDALKSLSNVESLEISWNRSYHVVGDPRHVFEEQELFLALMPGSVGGLSLCPKLRTLVCWMSAGRSKETPRAVVDFITGRRSPTRPASVGRLREISIMFTTSQERDMLKELRSRGVDVEGVSICTGQRDYSL